MNATLLDRSRLITECLTPVASRLREVRPGAWELDLRAGPSSAVLKARARLEDDLLLLTAFPELSRWLSRERAVTASFWETLRLNPEIPGLAKVCLAASRPRPYLAAEIPVHAASDLRGDVLGACLGMEAAAGRLAGQGPALGDGPPQVSPVLPENAAASGALDLSALCREAGWPFTERDGGRLAVELETAPSAGFHQALVQALPGEAGVGISVDLQVMPDLSSVSREALGLFLLTATGALRMPRAIARLAGEHATVGFEVRLGRAADAFAVGLALGACSVACDMCGPEVKVLQNERLARAYLAIRLSSGSTSFDAPLEGERRS